MGGRSAEGDADGVDGVGGEAVGEGMGGAGRRWLTRASWLRTRGAGSLERSARSATVLGVEGKKGKSLQQDL